jgi:hypothetical protein
MFFSIIILACQKPIEAPEHLEGLCSFLFSNHSLTEESEIGIENLLQWSEDNEIHEDGYRIDNLTQEDLQNSEAPIGDLEQQMGVAILHQLDIATPELAYAISGLSPNVVAPETFLSSQREYDYGEDCFWDFSCDSQGFYSNLEIAFPLGVVANGSLYSELKWVQTSRGRALLQRDWLLEEASMNVNWIHIDAQYSLSGVIPITEKKSLRIDSLWSVLRLGETPVDSDIGMSLLVGKSQKTIEEILLYLEEE